MKGKAGMNRRAFLGALGGAAVAPLLPAGAMAAPGAAGVSLSTSTGGYVYGLAVLRARMAGSMTAGELARTAPVSLEQASNMLRYMGKSGILRPGATPGTWEAVKPILRSHSGLRKARAATRRTGGQAGRAECRHWTPPDLRAFRARVRQIAELAGAA